MNYFETYKTRLQAYGNNSEEAYINGTKHVINKSFDESLFSTVIPIDDVDTDVIINQGRNSDEKIILLRPDCSTYRGAIAKIEGFNFLIIDFDRNKVYPIAKAQICNNTFTIKGEPTQTIIGYDHRGAPIYETVQGEDFEIPCIAETRVFSATENQPINLPEGRLQVTLPYVENSALEIDKEFTMYGTNYKIINVDKTKSINGIGLIIITGQRK